MTFFSLSALQFRNVRVHLILLFTGVLVLPHFLFYGNFHITIKGCGFVEFGSTEEADRAIKLNGKELLGRYVHTSHPCNVSLLR